MNLPVYKTSKKTKLDNKLNIWDIISIITVFVIFLFLAKAASGMDSPYQLGEKLPINLDINSLTYYALRSVLRMAIALFISLIFCLIIGYSSAKNKKAEMIFIPMIDILQSVPVLGFLSLTVVGFIWIFPNSLLGPECAAIFAIFTSQAWNMTLSVYQSIKLLPADYQDVGQALNLNAWQRFWRIELPYATPALLWNMMISLSGGWFFVVASEAISVNNNNILLPGIGSYIQTAINQSNLAAIFYAIIAMFIVILIYDQLFFRPLLKVATQFQDLDDTDDANYDDTNNKNNNKKQQYNSWVYDILQKTILIKKLLTIKDHFVDFWINKLAILYSLTINHYISNKLNLINKIKTILSINLLINLFKKIFIKFTFLIKNYNPNKQEHQQDLELNNKNNKNKIIKASTKNSVVLHNFINHLTFKYKINYFALIIMLLLIISLAWLFDFINSYLTLKEILYVCSIGLITGLKIFILVIICSLFWIPVGVYIGNRPNLSKYLQPTIQFLAAFPANLVYPILVVLIIKYNLSVEIWTAPLLIIGTQWYILFNIIAGINNISKDLKDVVRNLGVKNLLWWRKFMIPAIFPYYITGAMTAAGGAWNASIVAETITWGSTNLSATGLGSYITHATQNGDFVRTALGITIMSLYVTILNKLIWQRLYNIAADRYQMLN